MAGLAGSCFSAAAGVRACWPRPKSHRWAFRSAGVLTRSGSHKLCGRENTQADSGPLGCRRLTWLLRVRTPAPRHLGDTPVSRRAAACRSRKGAPNGGLESVLWPAGQRRPPASPRLAPRPGGVPRDDAGLELFAKVLLTCVPLSDNLTCNAHSRQRRFERMRRQRRCTDGAEMVVSGPGRWSGPQMGLCAPFRHSVPNGKKREGRPPSELSSEGWQVALMARVTKIMKDELWNDGDEQRRREG